MSPNVCMTKPEIIGAKLGNGAYISPFLT